MKTNIQKRKNEKQNWKSIPVWWIISFSLKNKNKTQFKTLQYKHNDTILFSFCSWHASPALLQNKILWSPSSFGISFVETVVFFPEKGHFCFICWNDKHKNVYAVIKLYFLQQFIDISLIHRLIIGKYFIRLLLLPSVSLQDITTYINIILYLQFYFILQF